MRLPRRITGAPTPMMEAMRAAIKAGLEVWQVRYFSQYAPLKMRQSLSMHNRMKHPEEC